MSYIGDKDFLIEVQKGNVAGHSLIHKFGRNDAVPNGSWAHVSLTPFAVANFPSSATTVKIKAGGSAFDDSSGLGAREVTVQGIDSSLAETSEAIVTAGASASSATSASFWRVHRAWVSAVGVYGSTNIDDIVIESGVDMITIAAGEGQTQYAGYTIPTGKTGYLLSSLVTVDGNKAADIRVMKREDITDSVIAPMASKRIMLHWDGVLGTLPFKPRSPLSALPALTDIWFEANGSGAWTEVSADFEILLVDD